MPNDQLPIEYDPSSGIPLTPLTLPVDDTPKPYVMASDLVGTQQQEQSLPVGYALNDAGIPFNIKTGKEDLPIIRRPSVLPIAKTPDGYTIAMPKVLDAAGSVMGPLAAGKVPLAAGEALLGSGAVRTSKEAVKSAEITPAFYSGLEKAVETAKPTIATADQWLGYLKNQPGVKSEELATVLKELPSGPITKEALGDIVKTNKVELGEVVKGLKSDFDAQEFEALKARQHDSDFNIHDQERLDELSSMSKYSQSDTKFSQYQLPGGENYKEMLLTLPSKKLNETQAREILGAKPDAKLTPTDIEYAQRKATDEFKSSHWDEPNVLAHIRMNDRYLPDPNYTGPRKLTEADYSRYKELGPLIDKGLSEGKDVKPLMLEQNEIGDLIEGKKEATGKEGKLKTLHLEEIQSDWGQGIRKNGFKGEKEKLQSEFDKIEKKIVDSNDENIMGQPNINDALSMAVDKKLITKDEANLYKRYTDVENGKALPDMPFKKNWHQLAIKKVLHKAATEGYEGISITPGDAQAARYDLSKQIDNITYNAPGSKAATKYGTVLKATDKNGNVVINKAVEPHELSDLIGKEAADKLLKTQLSGDKHILQNADLKVGGEGMRSFYDKIVKDEFNNIGKKYGSKVETRTLDNKQPVHYFKITPEMREKAKGGFPLFSAAPIIVPVNHDPFANSKKKGYTLVPIVGNPFGE